MLGLLDDIIRDPASCVVRVNGSEIGDLYRNLVEVSATLDRQNSAEATLVFETRRLEDGAWNVHDDDRIRPWNSIAVAATFGLREEAIFDGYIRQVKVEFPEQKGAATVTVTCQDTSLLLDRTQRNRRWGSDVPVSDSEIVTEILNDAGLSSLDTPGQGFTDLVVQQNESDIRFLAKRARENAYDLFFRESQLYFGPMRFDRSPQSTILVYAGTATSCIRFDLDDDGHHPDAVIYEIAGESDDTTQEQSVAPDLPLLGNEALSSANAGHGDFAWRMTREGISNDSQAQQRAQAQANDEALKIKATGELDGALYGHVLLAGDPVAVDGIGDRYGGRWYVTKVEHRFDMNGYRQTFEVARNAYGDDSATSSNPLAAIF